MNNYYIFMVNECFTSFYRDKPSVLYQLFEHVYGLTKNDLILGYRIFEQVAVPFDKEKVNQHFYEHFCSELSYSRKTDRHYYNNLYIGEDTKAVIHHSHIKLISNMDYPSFMHSLKENYENVLVCNFEKKNFFWLDKKNENTLVKSTVI